MLLSVLLFVPSTAEGQIFRRRGTGGYVETERGYYYRGREYIRGRDLPDNPNCPCPMCRDLVNAYNAAKNGEIAEESASSKLIGTPMDIVPKLVDAFVPKKDFLLLDPGCGDGRILIDAAKRYGCKGIGIEINPETYKKALENVKAEGLEDRIKIYFGDSRDYSFDEADGVVMFLFPDLINDLTDKLKALKRGARVVSYSHEIPLKGAVRCEDIYVWTKD